MADDWFSSTSTYQSTMDRSMLYVKLAQSERMEREIAKVNAKYDGSAAARIEEEINALADDKQEMSDWLMRIDAAQKKFSGVREWMLSMKATLATSTVSAEAFDLHFDALNSNMQLQSYDKSSLIRNTRSGPGTWREDTTVVSAGNMSADITRHFLGNDYSIELDGGLGTLVSDPNKGTLTGAGLKIDRSKLSLVSMTGDSVVFTDNTDPDNPVQYTGTVKRGGLGVLPSWLYGDLSVQANKDRALADLQAGFKKLARYELDYNIDNAQVSGMSQSITNKMLSKQAEFDKVANEEVDAKLAEKKAIKARFEIYTNALTLTSARAQNFIKQMFQTTAPGKKSLTEVMIDSVKG